MPAAEVGLVDAERVELLAAVQRVGQHAEDPGRGALDALLHDRGQELVGEVLGDRGLQRDVPEDVEVGGRGRPEVLGDQGLQVGVADDRQRRGRAGAVVALVELAGEEAQRRDGEALAVTASHAVVLVLHPLLGGGDELAARAAARQAHLVAEEVRHLRGPEVHRADVVAVVLEREAVRRRAEAAVGHDLPGGDVVLDLARVPGAVALGDEAALGGEALGVADRRLAVAARDGLRPATAAAAGEGDGERAGQRGQEGAPGGAAGGRGHSGTPGVRGGTPRA